ncbi:hypothetical protein KFL_000080250 [Klebsormidium nitens]|uniref:S-adenosyl-L-methionine-dependent methyltransferases superfamily protein n=1 Tax=Klebsormidium nitens TaxID=105231 RepID=A0A1Y1HM98_KLENI|nr:hypothetical protein KFL_000080250 [Klebsormidium nitens]|eukprot:GAQ78121.1 hypothetical protein KFL_000080250 [Klebsormidium nitens]
MLDCTISAPHHSFLLQSAVNVSLRKTLPKRSQAPRFQLSSSQCTAFPPCQRSFTPPRSDQGSLVPALPRPHTLHIPGLLLTTTLTSRLSRAYPPAQRCASEGRAPMQTAPAFEDDENEDEEMQVIAVASTEYNEIVVLRIPEKTDHPYAGAKVLLLDLTGNIHSMLWEGHAWTYSYWDEFVALPPVIPEGPVGFLGLAGGTGPALYRRQWPALQVEGWEIDGEVVRLAREHLGLADLERPTEEGGRLVVNVGDALAPEASVEGGFAGLVVDLFSHGTALPELWEADTWRDLKAKLRPGGRILVNVGSASTGLQGNASDDVTEFSRGAGQPGRLVLEAMQEVWPGELLVRRLDTLSDNVVALTGPLPDLDRWAAAVPPNLAKGVKEFKLLEALGS